MPTDRRSPEGTDRRKKERPTKKGYIVYFADDTIVEAPTGALVEVNFEQHFKTGVNKDTFAGAQSSTRAYWMAWEAVRLDAKRKGLPAPLEYEQWVENVVAIDSYKEPLPFPKERSAIQSPSSASNLE